MSETARVIELKPNKKQLRFLQAKNRYVAFGGARGGGKSWVIREQAVMDAVNHCTEQLGDSGRVLLRKSGTEPVLRVMSEANTTEECEKYVDYIINAMKESGHLIEVKK